MSEMVQIDVSDFIEVDESEIRRVTEVFNQLIKTVKAVLVYPVSSKLPQQFLEKLHIDFVEVLNDLEKLKLKVEADGIIFKDQPIYKSVSKAENFAHPFFRDGIVELEFSRELSFDELQKFVNILSLVMRSANVEDDLATMLWEGGFDKISYKLMDDSLDIETFEYGTSKLKSPIESAQFDYSQIFIDEDNLGLTEEDFDLDSEKNKAKGVPSAYKNIPDNVADYITGLREYDESEKSAIEEILKEDSAFESRQYVIDILYEILGAEKDGAGYNETLDLISKVRDDFIKTGDMEAAIIIFNMARDLRDALKNLGDEKVKRIEEYLKSFGASERIRILVDTLNNSKDINYSDVSKYLSMLSWEAIDPLVWALGELDHYSARRAVCQALETVSVERVDVLAKGIENPRWYVVRNVVMILGKIGSPQALNYFRKTINHADLKVRKETVVSAARIKNEDSVDYLIMALKDESESLQTLALKELVKRRAEKAYIHLEAMIDDKGFKNRPADQIKEILEGYAILGNRSAFEKLRKLATQKVIIPSERVDRIKFYAVLAMGSVISSEAYHFVKKVSASRNKRLADAGRRAINKRIKEHQNA